MRNLFFTLALVLIGTISLQAQQLPDKKISKNKKDTSQQNESQSEEKAISDFGLIVEKGAAHDDNGDTGYGLIGDFNSFHLSLDNNEIQGKNGTTWTPLYLNYWGGDINLGTRSTSTGDFNACNLLYVDRATERVGIGTNSPNYKLHVNGSASVLDNLLINVIGIGGVSVIGNNTGDARYELSNGGGTHYLFDDDSNVNTLKIQSAKNFAINTNGAIERMRIDSSGRTAINNSIANLTQLYIDSDWAWGHITKNSETDASTYALYGIANGGGTFAKYAVYGDVSNSSSTGNRYGVYGEASTAGSNSWAGYFDGDFYYTGTSQAPSDERLKKNINEMPSVLDKVKLLQPKTYEFRNEEFSYVNLAEGPQFGFISQEIENLFPDLVEEATHVFQTGAAGTSNTEEHSLDIKSLDYISLIPILTKAIQEQQEIIENQTRAINAYKEELSSMKATIQDIQNTLKK